MRREALYGADQGEALSAVLAPFLPAAFCDIGFHPDDGLYTRAFDLIVKRQAAVHVAVIGNSDRPSANFLYSFGERLYLYRAV